MKTNLWFSLLASLTLAACGGENDGASASGGGAAGKSCLRAYDSKPGDILKRDRLDAVFGTAGLEATSEVSTSRSTKGVSWSWPSDRVRKITVGTNTIEVPQDNQASVSNFKILAEAEYGPKDGKSYVEANYRSISKEEMAATQARMKEQLQKRVDSGEMTQEQANLAGGLGGGIMGDERIVESIDGVGDAARWTASDRTLAVGHRDVFFALYVDVSPDASVNRDKAIALAKEILKECE